MVNLYFPTIEVLHVIFWRERTETKTDEKTNFETIRVMRLEHFEKVTDFRARVETFLETNEAENSLFLSILRNPGEHTSKEEQSYMVCLSDDDKEVVAAAIRTPPFHLLMTRMNDEAMALILRNLDDHALRIPGVIGPAEDATRFSRAHRHSKGVEFLLIMHTTVYYLTKVEPLSEQRGHMREASASDLTLAADWVDRFIKEAVPDHPEDSEIIARKAIEKQRLFFWEDGTPVSMAAWVGETAKGVRVSLVYTPPEHRNKGYATACVGTASQQGLDEGKEHCLLFADQLNPTSNSIYMNIGYRPVCEFKHFQFGEN